jgi:hypothetical protein
MNAGASQGDLARLVGQTRQKAFVSRSRAVVGLRAQGFRGPRGSYSVNPYPHESVALGLGRGATWQGGQNRDHTAREYEGGQGACGPLHVFTILSKEKTTDPTIEARVRGRVSCCLLDGVRGMIEEL